MGQTSKNRFWKLQRICLVRVSGSQMSIEPEKLCGREKQAVSTLFFSRIGQAYTKTLRHSCGCVVSISPSTSLTVRKGKSLEASMLENRFKRGKKEITNS